MKPMLWHLTGALLCLSFFSSIQAKTKQHQDWASTPKNQHLSEATYHLDSSKVITPNAGPRVNCGANVFLSADYLLWKLTQDGMMIGRTGIVTDSEVNAFFLEGDESGVSKGTQRGAGFHWESGFRVALGFNLPHDGWDLITEYTWLRSKSSSDLSSGNVSPIGTETPVHDQIRSRQTRSYNVVNLELGRNFYASPFLMLRPHFGLSGTWQKQHWRVSEKAMSVSGTLGNIDFPSAQNVVLIRRNTNKTWGIGTRIGLDTSWHLTTQWSFFGDLAFTAMWSSYNIKRKDTISAIAELNNISRTANNIPILNIDADTFYRVSLVGETEIGLRWETWFHNDNYHILAQIGWSETVWLEYMPFIIINFDGLNNTSLHGLDIKFRFDF
ncbi:MAG: Lpg1974 family pore-forming outer membrane protein [Chlamydiota bacterium]